MKFRTYIYLIATTAISTFAVGEKATDDMEHCLIRARSLYLKGNYDDALGTVDEVLSKDGKNSSAIELRCKIEEAYQAFGENAHCHTRNQMLSEVDMAWERPNNFAPTRNEGIAVQHHDPTGAKLKSIIIPKIVFTEAPLSSAVAMLSELSVEHDSTTEDPNAKGINIVLIDPKKEDPKVTLSLRNVTLGQVTDFLTKATDSRYEIENGALTIRHGEANHPNLDTEFFPITRAGVIRMTGSRDTLTANSHHSMPPLTQIEEEIALKNFFQRAGVPFSEDFGAPLGSTLAFDGAQLIVTHTPRNLDRVRNILARYKETKQVEIETKFIEVQQGALEELGFKWSITDNGGRFFQTFKDNGDGTFGNNLRDLAGGFSQQSASTDGKIVLDGTPPTTIPVVSNAPTFPNSINLGVGSVDIGSVLGVLKKWQVRLIIDALEQHTGSDLMSSPKLTVLSGKTANITVAQVLRYPEAFGDIHSAVGTAGTTAESSSAGVTITAGTPYNFVEKNVGVEMKVTPIVEDDNHSISLHLDPKVTEFEGFVEYGGKSVAVSGKNTVTVPSGFFQPIFSTREIQTEVTIEDGSTVVMGGLTREESKMLHDKVPIIGDLPVVGKLFRSKGETNQKRNLLIFVTANIISTGGALQRQNFVAPLSDSTFRNRSVVTPSGKAYR